MLASFVSVALSALADPPFFDTAGRLQRGVTPNNDANKYFTAVHDGKSLVERGDAEGEWKPALLSASEAAKASGLNVFLGSVSEDSSLAPGDYWLLELSEQDEPPNIGGEHACWQPLRARAGPSVCDALENDEAALLATARGMAHWHTSVKFCASCGSDAVEPYRNGKGRRCANCGTRFRPRLDASVIVLVTDPSGEKCLLGRKKEWPAGRYSTLAGFLEFGETLEECVSREINEEAGVDVNRNSIEFVASQPWLFPRSMMVGFTCKVAEGATDLVVDHDELEDAQWFDKAYVREQMAMEREAGKDGPAVEGGFHVPSKVSLARVLVENWLEK